jgi:molybdopterin-guanine dinucleotide biosynthesis protein A
VSSSEPVAGVVLAGGLARRMEGADKPLTCIDGIPMLARAIERLRPQVDALVISANGDCGRFADFGLPVVTDTIAGYMGPLAGILAGMRWAQANLPAARFIVSVAADTPFFPPDLVDRFSECCGRDESTVSVAASPAGTHPVFGLWPIASADELERFLKSGETNKVMAFVDRHLRLNVPFENLRLPQGDEVDPFFNINTPTDAARAEEIAARLRVAANS